MKKILVAAVFAAFASTATAAGVITGSLHDFSQATHAGAAGNLGTCQYCHAPHLFNASNIGAGAPLWNRNLSGGAANVLAYTSTTFGQALTAASIGPVTLTCLSCHDGATMVNAVNNGGPSTQITSARITTATQFVNGTALIGTNLRDDHPVGVNYVTSYNADTTHFVAQANGVVGTLPLFATKVECGTCHDPHGVTGLTNFLRIANGPLCTACHIK
jgi:predicted CXXCH cytochrome family protein